MCVGVVCEADLLVYIVGDFGPHWALLALVFFFFISREFWKHTCSAIPKDIVPLGFVSLSYVWGAA